MYIFFPSICIVSVRAGKCNQQMEVGFFFNVFIIRHVVYSIVPVLELVTHQGCTLTAV